MICIYSIIILFIFLALVVCHWLSRTFSTKEMKIHGRHVMVTGGSSGIGKAIAAEILKREAIVTIIARNTEKLNAAKSELECLCENTRGKIYTLPLDITNPENVTTLIQKHIEDVGPVSMLVNCAGVSVAGTFEDISLSEFKRLIDINYLGSVHVTHAALPSMKSLPEGRIVLVSSAAGQLGTFGYAAYSPTKFALRGLAECLQMELSPYDIRVTLAVPPDTNTPGFHESVKTEPIETRLISETAGIFEPSDVAKCILKDSLKGKFVSSLGFEGHMLSIATCGMAPVTSIAEAFLQVVSLGVIRLIALFYLIKFDRIIKKCKNDSDKKLH